MLPSGIRPATVYVRDTRIERVVALDGQTPPAQIRDVGNLVVMPGIVDTHVHVNEPGRTDWEGFDTATRRPRPAASRPSWTCRSTACRRRPSCGRSTPSSTPDATRTSKWGSGAAWCRATSSDLEPLVDAGVPGFKCFLAPSGVDEFEFVDEADLRLALPVLKRRRRPLLAHAEWPAALKPIPRHQRSARLRHVARLAPAARGSRRDRDADRALPRVRRGVHIVHLAAAEALPLLRAARAEGLPITVETCPHYLTFCAEEIPDGATVYKCAPPIRGRANRDALWQALVDGDIDLVATDHSPCPPALKGDGDFVRAWGGIASLQLSLPAVWTGASARGVALDRLPEWMSAAPARLADLSARKGSIAAGKDADLVIWDPDARASSSTSACSITATS